MIEVTIQVKSSSKPDEPYLVSFVRDEGRVSVSCTCPAGMRRQLCKHKTGLIENDQTLLSYPEDATSLATAHKMIESTSLLNLYQGFKERRDVIEAQQKELKKELSGIKGMFGRQLHDGVK